MNVLAIHLDSDELTIWFTGAHPQVCQRTADAPQAEDVAVCNSVWRWLAAESACGADALGEAGAYIFHNERVNRRERLRSPALTVVGADVILKLFFDGGDQGGVAVRCLCIEVSGIPLEQSWGLQTEVAKGVKLIITGLYRAWYAASPWDGGWGSH